MLALKSEQVVWVSANKFLNVTKALRERLELPPARVIDKAEPG
jgi:hypothetical protein